MNLELKFAILKKFGCQADLAQALRISESRLSRIVRGRCDPGPTLKEAMAKILGVNQEDIYPSTSPSPSQAGGPQT